MPCRGADKFESIETCIAAAWWPSGLLWRVTAGRRWLGGTPAEVVVELAKTARPAPVVAPAEAEVHYVASKKLAEFVRAGPDVPGPGV